MKPDFIICGVQKCGTTSLLKYLSQHKNIDFQPPGTEIHFFDNDQNYEKGEAEFTRYFKTRQRNLIGQSTSTYIYDYVPERIHTYIPEVKLIFILRNPVDRAYSHFWHANSKYRETLTFEKALEIENDRISKGYWHLINFSYFNSGLYMKMLNNFLKYFHPDKLHCVILEELKQDPVNNINKVLDFLNLENIKELKTQKAYNQTRLSKYPFLGKVFNNKITRNTKLFYPLYIFNNKYLGKKYPRMQTETRKQLVEAYKKEIKSLEIYLGKDLSFWKK